MPPYSTLSLGSEMIDIPSHIQYSIDNSSTISTDLPTAHIKASPTNDSSGVAGIHQNLPVPGFCIVDLNAYTGTQKAVVDPRGYITLISAKNMMELVWTSSMTLGLIHDHCIWVRSDKSRVMELVSVNNNRYSLAMANSSTLAKGVTIDQVQIGDTVVTKSGITGVYMGYMSLYGALAPVRGNRERYIPQRYTRKHVMMVSPGVYFYRSSLQVMDVIGKSSCKIDLAQSVQDINIDIQTGKTFFTDREYFAAGYYSFYGKVKLVTVNHPRVVKMSLREVTIAEAQMVMNQFTGEVNNVVGIDRSGGYYTVMSHNPSYITVDRIMHVRPPGEQFDSIYLNRTQSVRAGLVEFDKVFIVDKHAGKQTYI